MYAIEGGSAEIRVKRLFGDFYHLSSTDQWEGVGILSGATYRGVYRRHAASGASDRAIGEHTIDWTAPDAPTVRVTDSSHGLDQVAQRWRRLLGSAGPRPVMVTPPPADGASGSSEASRDYVYIEELPEPVKRVPPVYPADVKTGVKGTVQLQALVLKDGTVGDVRVVRSIPELDAAAIACVRQWRFKPALSKGVPQAVWVGVPIKFAPP